MRDGSFHLSVIRDLGLDDWPLEVNVSALILQDLLDMT